MAAIKHTLQREVFLPFDERLVSFVHVTKNKPSKKKKASFLCVAVTTEKPVQASIYQVKKSDKADTYKKKASWMLRELKLVDGKDSIKESSEFDLHFEKAYRWIASSSLEKDAFITCLWKLSQRYLIQKPTFSNVSQQLLEETSQKDDSKATLPDEMSAVDEDYQVLSPKEESDLESMMTRCEFAITNAERFAEELAKDLSVLDGANIHSIMESEDQVIELMKLLDSAIVEANKVEVQLAGYDDILVNVKDQMDIMKHKDTLIQVQNSNHQKLLTELESLVKSLDLQHKHTKALVDGDLASPQGVTECTMAASKLQESMAAKIHPALSKMQAVQEQMDRFDKYKTSFAKRLSHHLNNLFIHQGNELGETLRRQSTDMHLVPHHVCHKDLMLYAELMAWLKKADQQSFTSLTRVYTDSLSKLYDREIKEFMELGRQRVMAKGEKKLATLTNPGTKLTDSSSSLNKPAADKARSASMHSLDSKDSFQGSMGSDLDLSFRGKYDQIFEKVLAELEPFCLAEQDFCIKFFHLSINLPGDKAQAVKSKRKLSETGKDDKMRKLSEASESPSPIWERRTFSYEEADGALLSTPAPTNEQRQINDEARRMMSELFVNLESELMNFIYYGDRSDNFNSLFMLVRMSQHVINAQDTGSYLSKVYGNCLVMVKRNFDKFVQTRIKAIEETRVSKKGRCGVIPFVHHFEEFSLQAESIFQGSDRRADLDKAYTRLITAIFDQIDRVAEEHHKTPKEVVQLENFHHLYAMLSQLKISCLENERKEAKQRYQESLHAYVTTSLGRPLEKLHTFFEGIENRVKSGIKEEEVSYQLAFSKQELRKVIKEYPGREVKKDLEHLWKKVEKHLCEEENLFQVVWHSIQDEFIKQYSHFEKLIESCYPGSGISLDFTINDILEFFSDIAKVQK